MSLQPDTVRSRPRRSQPPRRLRLLVGLLVASAALSGCTARMSMEVKASGTFDAVIELRDTTGTVFDATPDCSPYSTPEALGVSSPGGAQVSARPLTGTEGAGCEVTVTDVPVPEAGASGSLPEAEGDRPLVVRDGKVFKVALPPLSAPAPSAAPTATADTAEAPGAAPDGEEASIAPAAPPAGAAPGNETQAPAESLAQLVSTHLQITFPGAVVDGGGGSVDGRTVTWTDPDVISAGVQATGLATPDAGLSLWDRFKTWIAVGLVSAVLVAGLALARRRGRERRSPQAFDA